MNILRPIRGTTKKPREVLFATTDIEAHKWINFLCIGFYDGHNKIYKWFSNLNDYFDFIFDHCGRYCIDSIFAHFGGKYDFNFLLQDACFNNKYIVDDIIPRGSGLLCFTVTEKVPQHLTVHGNPHKITIRDSSALLPFALRSAAKAFQVEMQKQDIDYTMLYEAFNNISYEQKLFELVEKIEFDKDDKPIKNMVQGYRVFYNGKEVKKLRKGYKVENITYEVIEDGSKHNKIYNRDDLLFYLEADCIALWQVIHKFYEWPIIKKAGLCFTTASQAVKVWQTYLEKPIFGISKNVDDFVRESYFGGRTEVFRPIFKADYDFKKNEYNFDKKGLDYLLKQKKQGQLYYYDINSLYPTVMQANEFPVKCLGHGFKENYDPKGMGFWRCTVDVPKDMFAPPLPVKHTFSNGTEKLIFPTGRFKGIWSTVELEYAKSLGVRVIEIEFGYRFKSGGRIFKAYIDDMYRMRLKAKREGDSVNDILTKLMMNSTYGRLGLNTERENLVIDKGQAGVAFHSEIKSDSGDIVRFMNNPVNLDTSFTNVAIPAYVTSYARIMLHRALMKCKKDIYYCDTDSMFTGKKISTGDGLGQWKLEYTCKEAFFLLPKTYLNNHIEGEKFKKKLTMKGFDSKKIKGFTFDDFMLALAGEKNALRVIQEPKFATIKTALRKGSFLCMNYDPETNRKIDERKELLHFEKTGKKKKIVKDDYNYSERSLKSKYDKRIIVDNGFMTKPIHLELKS